MKEGQKVLIIEEVNEMEEEKEKAREKLLTEGAKGKRMW